MKKTAFLLFVFLLMDSSDSHSQTGGSSRVDLDDVNIQGELLSDDRIRLLSRAKNTIDDEIKVRTSFKEEMLELLPEYYVRRPSSDGH